MPVCDVFSQDAFYCSSVKVGKSVALEFNLLKVYFDIFNDISYCLSPFLTVSEPEMLTKYFFDEYLDFVHKVIKPKLMLIWNNSV